MYSSHQYLSIDPKKVRHAHPNAHDRPQTSQIVDMNADISELIKVRELRFHI